MKPSVQPERFRLVQLSNGTFSVHADAYGEKMHPGLGPAAEAEQLYVRQLKIRERMKTGTGGFVVWDVGLGAAANALTLLRLTRDLPRPLRLVSFDDTSGPLEFALAHAQQLGYFHEYKKTARNLLAQRSIEFTDDLRQVKWDFHLGDFPAWLAQSVNRRSVGVQALACPGNRLKPELQREHHVNVVSVAPHAIFFDAFSPAKNPAMWTLPLFTNLFQYLDPQRPCSLTTYSRSTMFRVTLLLAGFFVGRGVATGPKEETTVAANSLELIDSPLDRRWLERARCSDSAEPLTEPFYRKAPLTAESWEKLRAHPQFNS